MLKCDFNKVAGEHPCQSAISIKLLCNVIEIALGHGCSPVNWLHIFSTPFLKNRPLLGLTAIKGLISLGFVFVFTVFEEVDATVSDTPFESLIGFRDLSSLLKGF